MKELTIRRKVLRKKGTDKLYRFSLNKRWVTWGDPMMELPSFKIIDHGFYPDDAELIEVDVKIMLP